MSNEEYSNVYIDLVENLISNGSIKYYEYSDFKDTRPIGRSSFGNVYCASWKSTNHFFALKSFNNDKQTLKKVIKEVLSFIIVFSLLSQKYKNSIYCTAVKIVSKS